MEKIVFINNIVYEMNNYIDYESIERLKNILNSSLSNIELHDKKMLPSIEYYDNEAMLKRYVIDMIATNREKTTINQYLRAIKKFFVMINKSWDTITGEDITTYLAIRTIQDHISANYKDTLQTYISSFYVWAYKKNYIDKDIIKTVDRVKRTRKKIDRMTDEEIAIVRGNRKNIIYNALFFIMIDCGLRVSEIVDLKIENIDWTNRLINVWAEKTNEYRVAILTHDLEYALKELIGERTNGYVFTLRRGIKMSKNTIEKMARLLGEDADCHCKTTVHVFRKTFASIMYRKTHDILLVSKLLGHKDTAVTIRCYLKDDIDDIKYRRLMVS